LCSAANARKTFRALNPAIGHHVLDKSMFSRMRLAYGNSSEARQ
jgi:hypothetical protein